MRLQRPVGGRETRVTHFFSMFPQSDAGSIAVPIQEDNPSSLQGGSDVEKSALIMLPRATLIVDQGGQRVPTGKSAFSRGIPQARARDEGWLGSARRGLHDGTDS